MKVTATHKYDADVDTVFAAFCKPDFYKKKFAATGASNIRVLEKKKRGSDFYIKTERDVEADVPGVLKKLIGDTNTLTQSESWEADDDGYFNELEIVSEGVPVSIEGTMSVQPSGNGCVNRLSFEIECGIPFLGSKLEEFVARDMKKVLAGEYRFIKGFV